MLTKVYSASIQGIDAMAVTIETDIGKGAAYNVSGLADTTVKESYDRPRMRITINLAPADVKKEGSGFDLPITIGLLTASEQLKVPDLNQYMLAGELSLDGSLLPVKGALPMAVKARAMGLKRLIVPEANVTEAAVVDRLEVYGARNLRDVAEIMTGTSALQPMRIDTRALFARDAGHFDFDFSEVKGQESVKRAFEVACAGGHNLLMAQHGRGAGDHQNTFRGRQAAARRHADDFASFPHTASYRLARGPGGRRRQPDARRDKPGP